MHGYFNSRIAHQELGMPVCMSSETDWTFGLNETQTDSWWTRRQQSRNVFEFKMIRLRSFKLWTSVINR